MVAGSASGSLSGSLAGNLANPAGFLAPQDILTIGKGAVYRARPANLVRSGTDVATWVNENDPGTHDLATTSEPTWDAVNGYVSFDGSANYMAATDFGWTSGDRVSIYAVCSLSAVVHGDRVVALQKSDGTKYEQLSVNISGAADSFAGGGSGLVSGANDANAGTPEADGADTLYLIELHEYAEGRVVMVNGVIDANGTPSTLLDSAGRLVVGAFWNGTAYTGFGAINLRELVIADASVVNKYAEAVAYRAYVSARYGVSISTAQPTADAISKVGVYVPANYDGAGGNYVDASSASEDLVAAGVPSKTSDADGSYVLYSGDASVLHHASDATYTSIANETQMGFLAAVKQSSQQRMTLCEFSDDGAENGGADLWIDGTGGDTIFLRSQYHQGAFFTNTTWSYKHLLDLTELNLIGFVYSYCEPVLILNGDMYRIVDGGGNRVQDPFYVRNAQTYFRLHGHYGTTTTDEVRSYDAQVWGSTARSSRLYTELAAYASTYSSLATRMGFDHASRGMLAFAGQSNCSHLIGITNDASNVWRRIGALSRPAGIRYAGVHRIGTSVSDNWHPNAPYFLYRRLANDLQVSSGSDTLTVLWVNGETDSATEVASLAYRANMEAIFARLVQDTGRSDILHVITQVHADLKPATFPYVANTRGQQQDLAAAHDNVLILDIDDLSLEADETHHTQATSQELFQRALDAIYGYYGTENWNVDLGL